jgi:multidrug efflux system outer membrane protein
METLLISGALVCLGGCTMIPKYTRPAAPVPAAWPNGPAYKEAPQGAPAASDLKWRQFFNDERLQTVIDTALKNNLDLRVAALNVEKARALYRVQRAEIFPTAQATVSGLRERLPADVSSTGQEGIFSQYGANVGINSWEIDLFGRIQSLTRAALEQYFATDYGRSSAQVLLISEVASAYLTLAADRDNLKLARSTLETQLASYNLIKRRFEVGVVPEQDLRQVQTTVETARVDVAKYTQLTALDENALNLLVGAPVPGDLLPQDLSQIGPLPDVSPGTSSEVLLRRPDILQAESLLKAANANIGAARAAFFPKITLSTAIGTASADLTGLFKPGSLTWNYAPQAVMPIFDARLWPALKATKVDRETALTQYQKSIQGAFKDVADALARRGTLGDEMQAQKSLVDANMRTFKIATERYEKGTDIFLVVLDAQRSLYSAQQGLISIRLAGLSNQVQLYSVLGGGQE